MHVSVATGLPYDRLIEAFEGSLGKWDATAGEPLWKGKASWPDVEAAVAKMAEPFGLMVWPKLIKDESPLSRENQKCARFIWLAIR
jgi:hypothetical protein